MELREIISGHKLGKSNFRQNASPKSLAPKPQTPPNYILESHMNASADIRKTFIVTREVSFLDIFRKYPSKPAARLVFHSKYLGQVRMSNGLHRCPLDEGFDKISFVTITPPFSVPLTYSDALHSSDGYEVIVRGDLELSIKNDRDSILSATLRFEDQFTKLFNRITSLMRDFCLRYTAEDINSGKITAGQAIEAGRSEIEADHLPFVFSSARLSLDAPGWRKIITDREKHRVDTVTTIKGIGEKEEIDEATANAQAKQDEQVRRKAMADLCHELDRNEQRAKGNAATTKISLELVNEQFDAISKHPDMLGVLFPDHQSEMHRHKEAMASHNYESRETAMKEAWQYVQKVITKLSTAASTPIFNYQK